MHHHHHSSAGDILPTTPTYPLYHQSTIVSQNSLNADQRLGSSNSGGGSPRMVMPHHCQQHSPTSTAGSTSGLHAMYDNVGGSPYNHHHSFLPLQQPITPKVEDDRSRSPVMYHMIHHQQHHRSELESPLNEQHYIIDASASQQHVVGSSSPMNNNNSSNNNNNLTKIKRKLSDSEDDSSQLNLTTRPSVVSMSS